MKYVKYIDPFPNLLQLSLISVHHGGHIGGHNCIGAYGLFMREAMWRKTGKL